MPNAEWSIRPGDIPLVAARADSSVRNRQTAIGNSAARGFTLIELMVSMALVLVIILGVNAIFKMTSDTVNAGQALAAANRDLRSSMTVVYNDFQNAVLTDGPMLLIRSERVAAFRTAADEQTDRDYNPSNLVTHDQTIRTVDLNDDNKEGDPGVSGEVTGPFTYNTRNHRIDRVGFFASHLYRRQTGTEVPSGASRFIDDGASTEAYIWYGHLDQPDFKTTLATSGRFEHRSPGEWPKDKNGNNFYATDWILGRSVTLLRETPPAGQNYIAFNPTSPNRLTPLSPDSESAFPGIKERLYWSRFDLAQTSINAFKGSLQSDIANTNYGNNIVNNTWYELLGGEWANMGNARFQGYPYPDRPLTAYGLARTVPVFVRGCTQFIVEYAGDYLQQDPFTGAVVEASPGVPNTFVNGQTDGQIDFVLAPENPDPSVPVVVGAPPVRRIRWYGMPRNIDTWDDPVQFPMIRGLGGKSSTYYDVVPLRDILQNAGVTPDPATFFEHFDQLDPAQNYAAPGAVTPDPKRLRYYAAWGPSDLRKGSLTKPKMIRITMTVDDPNGRLTEGQTFEYVIDLP